MTQLPLATPVTLYKEGIYNGLAWISHVVVEGLVVSVLQPVNKSLFCFSDCQEGEASSTLCRSAFCMLASISHIDELTDHQQLGYHCQCWQLGTKVCANSRYWLLSLYSLILCVCLLNNLLTLTAQTFWRRNLVSLTKSAWMSFIVCAETVYIQHI